jgi:Spy/CpxP family protein refolding chaperone
LREAREEAVKVLVAEPFDKERFQAAQSRLLTADQKAREAIYQLYTEIAVNMTPEERHGFAQWRQKRRPMRNLLDEPEKQASDHPR